MSAKRATLLTLAVLMVTALSSVTLAEESITQVVQKVKPAVVTVITYDDAGKAAGQGTGFLVQAAHVITSCHVIEGAAKAEVKTIDGKTYAVKGTAGSDELADIVRLVLAQPVRNAKVLALAKALPQEGEKVVVVGSPLGLEHTVSDGIVSAVRDIPGLGKFIQVTAPMSPGSSGSPVVNLKGEVVGVACAILTEGQSLNFAIASEHVLALKSTETTAVGGEASRTAGRASGHLQKGIGFLLEEEYEKALPHLQAATKADLLRDYAWFSLGMTYAELGRYLEAIAAYEQAIRLAPRPWAGAYFKLGVAYGDLGRHADAIQAYKQAIRIDPDDAMAHYNLGVNYADLGRYADAVDAYKQAIRIDPDYAEAHCNLGVAYVNLGRYFDAADAYKQAIRLKPDWAMAQFNLGLTYLLLENKGAALEQYKILKKLDTEQANKLFDLIYE